MIGQANSVRHLSRSRPTLNLTWLEKFRIRYGLNVGQYARICVLFLRIYTSYMYICPRAFYFAWISGVYTSYVYFITLLFWNVYVVADDDVTIAGRALHYNATLSLAASFFAIWITSNSARYATTVLQLQVMQNSFILVLLQLCRPTLASVMRQFRVLDTVMENVPWRSTSILT